MDLSRYFVQEGDAIHFEESQASAFAKGVAGDFNPIHDPGTKRFCVPGDLLFSVLLHRYGAASKTCVQFSGMLDGGTRMMLPAQASDVMHITDARERALLSLFQEGKRYKDLTFVGALCEAYVKFSGQTFPGILVPLMKQAAVMINPERPLVIYKDMTIDLNTAAEALFSVDEDGLTGKLKEPLDGSLTLQPGDHDISVNGRKGMVSLRFNIEAFGQRIGSGEKNMVLSGLREYDDAAMQAVVDMYNARRSGYKV